MPPPVSINRIDLRQADGVSHDHDRPNGPLPACRRRRGFVRSPPSISLSFPGSEAPASFTIVTSGTDRTHATLRYVTLRLGLLYRIASLVRHQLTTPSNHTVTMFVFALASLSVVDHFPRVEFRHDRPTPPACIAHRGRPHTACTRSHWLLAHVTMRSSLTEINDLGVGSDECRSTPSGANTRPPARRESEWLVAA